MNIKKLILLIFPSSLIIFLKNIKRQYSYRKSLKLEYDYDRKRFYKHSSMINKDNAQKLIGYIIREYHVIEKGLTMPETKLGFGRDLMLRLCDACITYIQLYGPNEPQLQQSIKVIIEYKEFHIYKKYELDNRIISNIDKLIKLVNSNEYSQQKVFDSDNYFSKVLLPFEEFAMSRASIRNYSTEEVKIEDINLSLELATTTPSACNRQCWRTYVYTKKDDIVKILEAQGGNRGFGHLANKLIVITAEVGVFLNKTERNQAFIDGGMYAMNLLYSLHYNKIAGCILNCSFSKEKDLQMRKLCGIKDSEVFIAMVSCGKPPKNFKAALSKRYNYEYINSVHN